MREVLVNKLMLYYEKNPKYDKYSLIKIKYGAECFYSFFSKLIVIITIAAVLGILKNVGLFIMFYTPLRIFGFGFHASKNIWCWIISSISMLFLPYIAFFISLTVMQALLIEVVISFPLIYFCPADTKKRPLINRKKAKVNKIVIVFILIIYLLIIILNNPHINAFIIIASLWQLICSSPILYLFFKQPYNNYKKYNY